MTGIFVDSFRYAFRKPPSATEQDVFFVETDFGKIRVLDTKGTKPVIINVPDGPNVIEHQREMLAKLSADFRVICFEYPGIGLSYPNAAYDYSFDAGANLLLQLMDSLGIEKASLLFSCSNGFYAMKAAELAGDRFEHVFLSQTPSTHAMIDWTKTTIPNVLKVPVLGQMMNGLMAKKFAHVWYQYALPKESDLRAVYRKIALESIQRGGCFCLASLVQGLMRGMNQPIQVEGVPVTLVWGAKDFTHRKTGASSIHQHIKDCEIVEFGNCGHFPELEDTKRYMSLVRERLL